MQDRSPFHHGEDRTTAAATPSAVPFGPEATGPTSHDDDDDNVQEQQQLNFACHNHGFDSCLCP